MILSVDEDVEEPDLLCLAVAKSRWHRHFGKRAFLQMLNMHLPQAQQTHA